MPSPLGHALAGIAAGGVVTAAAGQRFSTPDLWRFGTLFAAAGTLPDADLLFGIHSGPTHGVGAAIIVGLALFGATRRAAIALAAAAAYGSHSLLDWLGSDSSPPIGIMALWPFSRQYYESDLHVFQAISRRFRTPGFWAHNVKAIAWEMLLLVPPAVLIFLVHKKRSRARADT